MKRAEVYRNRNRRPASEWVATVHEGDIPLRGLPIWDREDATGHDDYFPTHAAALAHALAEVGLNRKDPASWRCPMRATDPITTRHPRDDGWRCGHEAGHAGGHTLYSSEGESVLFAGRWVHPAEVGLTEKEQS